MPGTWRCPRPGRHDRPWTWPDGRRRPHLSWWLLSVQGPLHLGRGRAAWTGGADREVEGDLRDRAREGERWPVGVVDREPGVVADAQPAAADLPPERQVLGQRGLGHRDTVDFQRQRAAACRRALVAEPECVVAGRYGCRRHQPVRRAQQAERGRGPAVEQEPGPPAAPVAERTHGPRRRPRAGAVPVGPGTGDRDGGGG